MSRSSELADALVAYLDGLSLSIAFTPTREHWPPNMADESDILYVNVYSGPRGGEQVTRGAYSRTYVLFVTVMEKVTGTAAEMKTRADALDSLMEEIELAVEDQPIDGAVMEGYDSTTERLPFNLVQLRDQGVFVAVIGLQYQD